MIHTNIYAYSENTLNGGAPFAANQTRGNGFFTAPARRVLDAAYLREVSPTFMDYWTQPRLFWNSLPKEEQQMVVNAARFELSNIQSTKVRQNVLAQFNRISNELANRVAVALGLPQLGPDPKYYHNNKTVGVSTFGRGPLPSIIGFKVGIMATTKDSQSLSQAKQISDALTAKGLKPTVIAETLFDGVGATYSGADAVLFDAVVVADNTKEVFTKGSSLYPTGRPAQILRDAFNYGKPVGAVGDGKSGFDSVKPDQSGVYFTNSADDLANKIAEGLKTFKFTDRFPLDE
jgi:catalase